MNVLDLSLNNIKDNGASKISLCVHNFKMLVLKGCGITKIDMLAEAIGNHVNQV